MPIIVEGGSVQGTSVVLQAIWLNVASEPSDAREFPFVSSYSHSGSVVGDVRVGASGRERLVTRAGRPQQAQATLAQCTREDITWLEDHIGMVICIRDDRGRKWFGSYLTVPADESVDDVWADVSLTFKSVTYSEAA